MTVRKIHMLKCWPKYYDAVVSGEKTFEVRKNDRDFQRGDTVILNRYDPELHEYTGEQTQFSIGFVLDGGAFGLESGYVCFSLMREGATHFNNTLIGMLSLLSRKFLFVITERPSNDPATPESTKALIDFIYQQYENMVQEIMDEDMK